MKKLILSVVLANLLAACGSNPPKEAVAEPKPVQVAPAPVASTSVAAPIPETSSDQADADVKAAAAAAAAAASARAQADASASAAAKAKAAAEAETAARAAAEAQARADASAAALAKRSVFFPFDVDAVQSADTETILAHGKNLSEHANLKARVEGNADERGSSEYNLALGQRRANNTRKALVLGGARSAQIETVSYGEEKPRAAGHDEMAWAQNRRADIEYSSGK